MSNNNTKRSKKGELEKRAAYHKKHILQNNKGKGWFTKLNGGDVEYGLNVFNKSLSSNTPSTNNKGKGEAPHVDAVSSTLEALYILNRGEE